MDRVYLHTHHLRKLVDKAAFLVSRAASNAAIHVDKYRRQFPPMLLDLPCTLFAIRTRLLPAATVAARNIRFAPEMLDLALLVLKRMADRDAQGSMFNGIHLRMELDAFDWARTLGGHHALLQMFIEVATMPCLLLRRVWVLTISAGASRHIELDIDILHCIALVMQKCRDSSFSKSTDLYIASGLLTYNGNMWKHVTRALTPYARQLIYKELFLTPEDLHGLHAEQLALVDFLVLVKANRFVGISTSTFSVFIREYRHIMSIADRETSEMVQAAAIGTEPMFARSAVFL